MRVLFDEFKQSSVMAYGVLEYKLCRTVTECFYIAPCSTLKQKPAIKAQCVHAFLTRS